MTPENGPWTTTPRRYRPTYSYLPSSVSMSDFGSPFPPTVSRPAPKYHRRRTTATFPAIDLLHSAPTVASSSLTASVSSNDISHPTPKVLRLPLQARTQTPTRIPTPSSGVKLSSQIRAVSSPVVPLKLKENMPPTAHRLLGPIQPGPVLTGTLTKSRTMNVISSLTSTFSRSSHTLTSSRTSFGNLSSHTVPSTTTSLPLPAFTANIRQISTSMPLSYWLGRFQALHDRFQADHLDAKFLDSPTARKWMQISEETSTSPAGNDSNGTFQGDERLAKRVFAHLEALCVNNEARKSLKAFQQAYARKVDYKALLPVGGTMVDKEPGSGLMAKAGRLFSGGRKSSFGVGTLGKRSTASLGLEDANANANA